MHGNSDDFGPMLLRVVVVGVVSFGIAGAFLYAFWRALQRESESDRPLRRVWTLILLALLIVVIAVIASLFMNHSLSNYF
jgi:uncharacterized membrane protein